MDLLLAKWEPHRRVDARDEFAKEVPLCQYLTQQAPTDYWRKFDLADALLFSGMYIEAQIKYDEALNLVQEKRRDSVIASVLGPMKDFIAAGVLDTEPAAEVASVIHKLTGLTASAR
jgi:hypothetical protein